MEAVRSADSSGLFIFLGVIYFILSMFFKEGKKVRDAAAKEKRLAGGDKTPAQPEAVSLESILGLIETVKQKRQQEAAPRATARQSPPFTPKAGPPRQREVVQDARGPLGRTSKTRLQSDDDVEDRTSLEDEGRLIEERRLQNVEVFTARPERVVQNRDEEAEAVAQRRIKSVESRNRPQTAADHSGSIRVSAGPRRRWQGRNA